ncbi:hypothetical protein [Streptomyces coeruleorubidus]|uniref:hypothetical protein n=1 Tax=Streptomyces coeruleorubidus TaxID=116188 RepID=UPI003F53F74F
MVGVLQRLARPVWRGAGRLTTPLLPDDFLAVVDPLWSARRLASRVEKVRAETADATTVVVRAGRGRAVRASGGGRRRRNALADVLESDPDGRLWAFLDHRTGDPGRAGAAVPGPPGPARADPVSRPLVQGTSSCLMRRACFSPGVEAQVADARQQASSRSGAGHDVHVHVEAAETKRGLTLDDIFFVHEPERTADGAGRRRKLA